MKYRDLTICRVRFGLVGDSWSFGWYLFWLHLCSRGLRLGLDRLHDIQDKLQGTCNKKFPVCMTRWPADPGGLMEATPLAVAPHFATPPPPAPVQTSPGTWLDPQEPSPSETHHRPKTQRGSCGQICESCPVPCSRATAGHTHHSCRVHWARRDWLNSQEATHMKLPHWRSCQFDSSCLADWRSFQAQQTLRMGPQPPILGRLLGFLFSPMLRFAVCDDRQICPFSDDYTVIHGVWKKTESHTTNDFRSLSTDDTV